MAVSFLHEGLLELIRDQPGVIADLLTRCLDVRVPRFTQARLTDPVLNEIIPVEHFADAVVLLIVKKKPVLGVIVEAQLRKDRRKHYTWPFYAMAARARHECPFVVVVLTTKPLVARWASRPIHVGNGTIFRSHVIGPAGIPKLTNAERAARDPQLAVLSVMAHGRANTTTARQIALAAIAAVSTLRDRQQRELYSELVERALSEATRKALEMLPQTRRFFSESQRRSYDKGITEGQARGEVKALLKILTQRGLRMSADQRRRITGCTDPTALDRWLDRSFAVASVDELLADIARIPRATKRARPVTAPRRTRAAGRPRREQASARRSG